jgi:DNA-binding transcriptional MerR regulator
MPNSSVELFTHPTSAHILSELKKINWRLLTFKTSAYIMLAVVAHKNAGIDFPSRNIMDATVDMPARRIPISDLYEIAHIQWGLPPRTIQWYVTEGIIPLASRVGRNAYYDRASIFGYLDLMEILVHDMRLSISQVRDISKEIQRLGPINTKPAILVAAAFLNNFLAYRDGLTKDYIGSGKSEASLDRHALNRIKLVRDYIIRGLKTDTSRILKMKVSDVEDIVIKKGEQEG